MTRLACVTALLCAASLVACKTDQKKSASKSSDKTTNLPDKSGDHPGRRARHQVPPPPDVAAIPDDAQRSQSGLAFKLLKAGTSDERPGPNDTVMLNYTGWKSTGEMYITTTRRNRPQPMSMATAAVGWKEALAMMTVGEKRRLWMTPALAFQGQRKGHVGDLMVYDVELVSIKRAPATPEDLTSPPADAPRTKSGIAYRTLKPATGTEAPKPWDDVTINFSGWASDGRMIASSVMNGKPQTFSLYRKGEWWPEAITTLKVGQKNRFWIPGTLSKRPADKRLGDTVFDIELVSVKPQHQPPPTPEHLDKPPANARKTKSGLAYVVIDKGTGKVKATKQDLVKVNFTVWASDGQLQDSSVIRGEPADYAMNRMPLPAWTEVLEQMVVGEKVLLWVPGDRLPRRGRKAPKVDFVFQLELVARRERPKPPPTPEDVAAPPANAHKTDKGVYYVVLQPGTGKEHPDPKDRVAVNYTGWTTDGKQFDSSIPNDEPAKFRLNGVIEGWTDGLQTMVVGQKNRFWIPEELAYKGKPGRPQGMLVFDVELVDILEGHEPRPGTRPRGPRH